MLYVAQNAHGYLYFNSEREGWRYTADKNVATKMPSLAWHRLESELICKFKLHKVIQ